MTTDNSKITYIEIDNDGSEDDIEFLNYLGFWEYDNTSETGSRIFNAYDGERVIGSIKWDIRGEIIHIYVREDYEGRGIMRGLLDCYDLPPSHVYPGNFIDHGLYEKVCSILLER